MVQRAFVYTRINKVALRIGNLLNPSRPRPLVPNISNPFPLPQAGYGKCEVKVVVLLPTPPERPQSIPESYPTHQAAIRALAARLQDIQNALPHLSRLLAGINSLPDARLAIVICHRGRLVVVGLEPLLQRVFVVVGSLDQRLAGDVVCHVLLGRIEDFMVGSTRCRVDEAAGYARY